MSNREELEEAFGYQINNYDETNESRGKSIFDREYESGQQILHFLLMELGEIYEHGKCNIIFNAKTIQYPKEIDELADNFDFVEMKEVYPVLVPKLEEVV